MIDIKIIRNNPNIIKNDLIKRFNKEKISWIDDIKNYDIKRRQLLVKIEQLRHKRNLLTSEIAQDKKKDINVEVKVKEAKKIFLEIRELEKKANEYKSNIRELIICLPNLTHESVPQGENEDQNVEIKKWGSKPKFSFIPRDHIDIGINLDLIDLERAAKVSGARFYYLKKEAVHLGFALIKYTYDIILKEGFIPIIPPVLVRKDAMFGAGFLPEGEEDIYWIKNKDLCLSGTAEIPLAAMHMNEILDEDRLPLYYSGFSTCFRTEAGAHGRDTKGIFRVHQFDKLELFKFTHPEESWEEHEKLLNSVEKIYRGLDLHYRVVNICSAELGNTAAKKYDIELWFPSQNKFREVVSCSNCTDYQSRRLNIRCRKRSSEKTRFVHTLNSTAIAVQRVIVGILENYQQEDGMVKIPSPLKKYLDFQSIEKR